MKRLIIVIILISAFGFYLPVLADTQLKEQFYVVKKGDKPADIFFVLREFYHIPKNKILKWNPDMGLHLIYPGQKIKYYLPQDFTKTIIKGETDKIITKLDQLKKEIGEVGILGVTNKETKRGFWLLIFLSIVIFLAVVISSIIVVKKTPKQLREKVRIKIGDEEYDYYPRIKDGKFISLYRPKKGKNFQSFSKISDLRKSVYGSLKKNPELIAQEIKAGRLVQQKQK